MSNIPIQSIVMKEKILQNLGLNIKDQLSEKEMSVLVGGNPIFIGIAILIIKEILDDEPSNNCNNGNCGCRR